MIKGIWLLKGIDTPMGVGGVLNLTVRSLMPFREGVGRPSLFMIKMKKPRHDLAKVRAYWAARKQMLDCELNVANANIENIDELMKDGNEKTKKTG